MKILWMAWKDNTHPLAGGAEVVKEALAARLVRNGHEVTLLVAGYPGSTPEEQRDGYRIIRVGGRFSVYWHAYRYYTQHLVGWADLVLDEINTIPFFASWYVREKTVLFFHQLARRIWFYQMVFPLSVVGYLLEPLYLWLLRNNAVVTISESTKQDLMRYGFHADRIQIISEGITLTPVATIDTIQKYEVPTLLSLGAIRPMKRTLDAVKAFERTKVTIPTARLILAGDTAGAYGAQVLAYIAQSPYRNDIQVLGRVSGEKKIEIMQRAHAIIVTSVKEGWGLIVTEANSQGTPAVVYNVDGLRDSVNHRNTGLVCTRNTPEELAANIVNLLTVPEFYDRLRRKGWEWSKTLTFDQAYRDFVAALHIS
jgi:glycosyltransferase involved in cell wall biosynthesis